MSAERIPAIEVQPGMRVRMPPVAGPGPWVEFTVGTVDVAPDYLVTLRSSDGEVAYTVAAEFPVTVVLVFKAETSFGLTPSPMDDMFLDATMGLPKTENHAMDDQQIRRRGQN